MKKIFVLIILMLFPIISVFCQELDDNPFDPEFFSDDEGIFEVKYTKKSAAKAMLFSAVFPGAGQIYANPKSITAYIFPLIEIGLWYGYTKFSRQGNDKEIEYTAFADDHYDRQNQYDVQIDLIQKNIGDIYNPGLQDGNDESNLDDWEDEYGNGGHFNLDLENTQHYYEDIGKYNRYLFGWQDWYEVYALHPNGFLTNPNWEFDSENKWIGMGDPTNPGSEYYISHLESFNRFDGKYSIYRSEYIKMRRDAENLYDKAVYCSFGIVMNHIAGTLDALRVTKKKNWELSSNEKMKIRISPVFVNNTLSPAIYISKGF